MNKYKRSPYNMIMGCSLSFLIVLSMGFAFADTEQQKSVFIGINSGSVSVLSRQGSRGEEVKKIQQKLQSLGFYKGKIDSIFGVKTKDAVHKYQASKGLKVDGIAGPQTLKSLGIATTTSNPSGNQNNIELLARVISAEARDQPYNGQVAVGGVILNRIEHPSFPNSLAGVIYQPGAFTCITDGQIDKPVADSARRAARDAFNGQDPSCGAIYYYNPAKTTNKWIYSRPVVVIIGKHRFAK